MTDSIQNSSSMSGMSGMMGRRPPSQSLTDDQKSQITDILSQYDSENITKKDAQSIFKAFSDAGIQPSRELRDQITAAGYDADKLRDLGMPEGQKGGQRPPPPPGGMGGSGSSTGSTSGVDMTALKTLQSILSKYDLTNLSSDDQSSLFEQLNKAGLTKTSGSTINLRI